MRPNDRASVARASAVRVETPAGVAEIPEETFLTALFSPTREDILRLIELTVIALLTLVVLLFVVRPMVRKAIGPGGGGGTTSLLDMQGGSGAPVTALPQHNATTQMLEIAKINGQIRAETVDQVGNMVAANPQETVAVLRGWIHER